MCGILKFNIGITLKAFSFLIFVNFVFVSNLGHKNTFYNLVHKVKSWSLRQSCAKSYEYKKYKDFFLLRRVVILLLS